MRLSDAFPGEAGKDRIITAYLNEIFYGHGAYGDRGRGRDLFRRQRPGEADAGAGRAAGRAAEVARRPSTRTATPRRMRRAGWSSRPTARRSSARDWILDGLADGARWTTADAGRAPGRAIAEPVILAGDQRADAARRPVHLAGHDAARRRSSGTRRQRRRDRRLHGHHDPRLAGAAARREVADRGGHRPRTCREPRATPCSRASRSRERPALDQAPCAGRTSTTAPSSPSTTRPATSSPTPAAPATTATTSPAPSSQPKFDAAGDGSRQPGSALKPILYASAFDSHKLTPGSLLLDVTTKFDARQDWVPRDADQLERGRSSSARRSSTRSTSRPSGPSSGSATRQVDKTAEALGIRFAGGRDGVPPGRAWPARSGPSRSDRSTSPRPTARWPTAATGCRRG